MKEEAQLQKAVIEYLTLRGFVVWRQNQGAVKIQDRYIKFTHGIKGISDVIGFSQTGQFIAVECKVQKRKPTAIQRNFLQLVNDRGGIGLCIYSLNQLEEELQKYV